MGLECCQLRFSPTDPRCHSNEIWHKIGYNSACLRDFCEIFAFIEGFSGMGLECCQLRFSPTDPRCHGNEIWDKMNYNSACLRDFCEIFAFIGGFSGMGHRMLPIALFPDRPPLPRQRNFGQNSVCVRDICEIFASMGGFSGRAIKCCQSHFRPPTMTGLPWQRNLGQNWLELGLCKRYLRDSCV